MQKKYILSVIIALAFKTVTFGQETTINAADTESYNKYSLPLISAGLGILTPFCDISTYDGKIMQIGRFNVGGTFAVEQRIGNYLGVSLDGLKGSLCADDNRPDRHLNFKTNITQGTLNVKFHFDNGFIINKTSLIAPFVSVGFGFIGFKAYSDLRDKNGKLYHYWPDGTIRDQAFDHDNPQNGAILVRDYKFETKLDSLNQYTHHSFIIPVGGGINFKFSDRLEANISSYYFFTQTSALDNLSYNNANKFNFFSKHTDNYLYTSVTLQYNIGGKSLFHFTNKNYEGVNFKKLYKIDSDGDGVPDSKDKCPDTPKGVKVDKNGCPIDSDGDGVPDYLDKEPNTPKGNIVDENGVTITPQMVEEKYIRDSLIMAGILVLNKDTAMTVSEVNDSLVKSDSRAFYNSLKYLNGNKSNSPNDKVSSIVYHVELGTLASPDSSLYFQEKYSINEKIYVTPSNGAYKYSVGNFHNLDSAKQYASIIKEKTGLDGTVVSYNNIAPNATNNNNILAVNNNSNNNNTNTNPNTTEVITTVEGIVYRAQIGSLASPDSSLYFQKKFNLNEKIYVESKNGVYKYSVGNFSNYNDAKLYASNIKAKTGINSFVVASKNGSITNANTNNLAVNNNNIAVNNNNLAVNTNTNNSNVNPNISNINTNTNTSEVKTPVESIIYRAQIGSLASPDSIKYYQKKFNLNEKIYVEPYQGAYKYSIGNFSSYDSAKQYANSIKTKTGINSFVIASKNGSRVKPVVTAPSNTSNNNVAVSNNNVNNNTNVAVNNNNNVTVSNNYTLTTINPDDPGSILYRAQIGSLASGDLKSYFKEKYNINEVIYVDAFQGLYKYSVGTFKTYTTARQYANGIKDKTGINSFVIAFQKGLRVSTTAAKAITDK